MTDKEKLEKVIAEIERRIESIDRNMPFGLNINADLIKNKFESLLLFIDSMQEEPKSFDEAIQEGDDVRYNEDLGCRVNLSQLKRVAKKEATGKLKECIDNITEESLAKARKQLQEESKVCMYSTANYTNADRLTLCKDCKELCRYNQKTAAESLCISQEAYDEIVDKCLYGSEVELVNNGDLPKGEPVSEDLKEAYERYVDERMVLLRPDIADMSCDRDTKMSFDVFDGSEVEAAFYEGANWQKKKDDYAIEIAHMAGEEEGKNIMKQQMMNNAITAEYWDNSLMLDAEMRGKYEDSDKVKVLIIKNE